jgi:CubicO group peptidase (beta-lactamase class C family)
MIDAHTIDLDPIMITLLLLAQIPEVLAPVDATARAGLADWSVPGLSIAVVRDDHVLLARGYGVKKLGEKATVDENTVFGIGSCTKAFTSALIAGLVGEKKLTFDDRVVDHLPWFAVQDPWVTRTVTVRDLLSHRSGIGQLLNAELLWYGSDLGREEILRRLRHETPLAEFRNGFSYSNFAFLAAGEVAAKLSGQSWDTAVAQRIFTPAGMNASNSSVRALAKLKNVAAPHEEIDGKLETVPWRSIDNMGAGGSINSTAVDMARWVRLQLGNGKIDGKQVIDAAALIETRTPQTVVRISEAHRRLHPGTHFRSYDMGWGSFDYAGRKLDWHAGGVDGMNALVALIPEEKMGLAVLMNRGDVELHFVLAFTAFDALLGRPQHPWNELYLKEKADRVARTKKDEQEAEAARVKNTQPSHALAEYAGKYSSTMFGEVVVEATKSGLYLKMNRSFEGPLEHFHYDTFRAVWRDRYLGKSPVSFSTDSAGKVTTLRLEDLLGTAVFSR